MPTFAQFWEWLNQGIYIIPTLGIQNGAQTVAAQKVLEIQSPQDRFFVIHAIETCGVIVVPNGNQDNFTVDQAQRTWDRFFGMLATSARSDGFHHSGGQIATPLPRLLAHQMSSAYLHPKTTNHRTYTFGLTAPITPHAYMLQLRFECIL
jgi:hypothetical protein